MIDFMYKLLCCCKDRGLKKIISHADQLHWPGIEDEEISLKCAIFLRHLFTQEVMCQQLVLSIAIDLGIDWKGPLVATVTLQYV